MPTYHADLLDTPVPRYTSFPTAAEFTPDIGAEDFTASLEQSYGDVSLYVHIPFCEQICWYCGCNTAAANRSQRLESYLAALHREVSLVGARLPATARVRRIAFGGGSPNAISPVDFVRLFDALTVRLPLEQPVVSVELDPRTLTDDWRPVLQGIGVTRASLGVQTFAPHLQERIGRVQPRETIERSVDILRGAGVTSLNFDLMYGLPGQTEADLAETLASAADMHADRIALFGYAHVPHLIPRQRRIDGSALPGPEARFRMAAHGEAQLAGEGYCSVGFDHFALPGDPLAQAAQSGRLRRNFQGFTDDPAEVLVGLGASAISSFPHLLAQNEKNAGRYRMLLSQDHFSAAAGIRRSNLDRMLGRVIEALLCYGSAYPEYWMVADAWPRLAPYIDHGLARFDGRRLQIEPDAMLYARSIAAAFDPYRQHSPRRFSSAV